MRRVKIFKELNKGIQGRSNFIEVNLDKKKITVLEMVVCYGGFDILEILAPPVREPQFESWICFIFQLHVSVCPGWWQVVE